MSAESQSKEPDSETVAAAVAQASSARPDTTVFDTITDFSVAHPLLHKWTLWYIKPPSNSKEAWSDLLKEVVTVSTVEEFWGAYNSIPKIFELPLRSDYAFFRDGITPEWEHAANKQGGRWLYQFKERRMVSVDDVWLKLLLGLIGGTLDDTEPEMATGCFANIRKVGIRINLWTTDTSGDSLMALGRKFKETLQLTDGDEVEFGVHDSKRSAKKIIL